MKAIMYNYNTWLKYKEEKIAIAEFEKMLLNSGFTIIEKVEHFLMFKDTLGLWLLAESHFAIHTFPEENKMYIEISSCVKKYFDNFLTQLSQNSPQH